MAVYDPDDAWQVLGLERGEIDARAIKRAYARKLREHRPEDDPEGFRDVRDAYEMLRDAPPAMLEAFVEHEPEAETYEDPFEEAPEPETEPEAQPDPDPKPEPEAPELRVVQEPPSLPPPVEERWRGPPPADHAPELLPEPESEPAPEPPPSAAPGPPPPPVPPPLPGQEEAVPEGVDAGWRARLRAAYRRPVAERGAAIRAAMVTIVEEAQGTEEGRERLLRTLMDGFPAKAAPTLATVLPADYVGRCFGAWEPGVVHWAADALARAGRVDALHAIVQCILKQADDVAWDAWHVQTAHGLAAQVAVVLPDDAQALSDALWAHASGDQRRALDLEDVDHRIQVGRELLIWRPAEKGVIAALMGGEESPLALFTRPLLQRVTRALGRTQEDALVRQIVRAKAPRLLPPPPTAPARSGVQRVQKQRRRTGSGGLSMGFWIAVGLFIVVRACMALERNAERDERMDGIRDIQEQLEENRRKWERRREERERELERHRERWERPVLPDEEDEEIPDPEPRRGNQEPLVYPTGHEHVDRYLEKEYERIRQKRRRGERLTALEERIEEGVQARRGDRKKK